MPFSNLTAVQIKSLLDLVVKRDALLAEAEVLNEKIDGLSEPSSTPDLRVSKTQTLATKAAKPVKRGRKARRTKRGGLQEAVLNAIAAAGKNGTTFREISKLLKIKPANVYSSLHYSLKTGLAGLTRDKAGKFFYTPAAPKVEGKDKK